MVGGSGVRQGKGGRAAGAAQAYGRDGSGVRREEMQGVRWGDSGVCGRGAVFAGG